MDGERVDRFLLAPLETVFGEEERRGVRPGDLRDGERLCAAFCVKEALLKALGEPFDYRECQVEADLDRGQVEVRCVGELGERLRGTVLEARVWRQQGEVVAAVLLFDPPPSAPGGDP